MSSGWLCFLFFSSSRFVAAEERGGRREETGDAGLSVAFSPRELSSFGPGYSPFHDLLRVGRRPWTSSPPPGSATAGPGALRVLEGGLRLAVPVAPPLYGPRQKFGSARRNFPQLLKTRGKNFIQIS